MHDHHYPESDEATYILSSIQHINNTLISFKGIGNLKLNTRSESMNTRAAWMGTRQGNFRVEIFGFPGQSAVSYSNDGSRSYLHSHLDNRFYMIESANPSLESILSIPITSQDLSTFLSGKIPVYVYDENKIEMKPYNSGYVIHLKKGCFGHLEKLYVDENKTHVEKVELFNSFGSLIYRAELNMRRIVDGYTIPFEIIISTKEGNRLSIHVDKCWTDETIPSSAFTLSHPE